MKKIIKNNIKLIMGVIIGIVMSGITVITAATILYNADQVLFTSKYSDFTATDVKEALDFLYNRSAYFDNINATDCISGIYHHNADSQWDINIGFVPSAAYFTFQNTYADMIYLYNKTVFGEKVYGVNTLNTTLEECIRVFNISSTITTTWNVNGKVYKPEYDLYYVVCK